VAIWPRLSFVPSGALIAPDYATRAGWYRETLWMPQGWPYAHPVQDVDADIKAIRAGRTSRTKVVPVKGEDPEEVDAEIAADLARERRLNATAGWREQ